MTQALIDSGAWDFHAARLALTDPCPATGCGHRFDAHWNDDTLGVSCDICCAYCEVRA